MPAMPGNTGSIVLTACNFIISNATSNYKYIVLVLLFAVYFEMMFTFEQNAYFPISTALISYY